MHRTGAFIAARGLHSTAWGRCVRALGDVLLSEGVAGHMQLMFAKIDAACSMIYWQLQP